MGTHPTSGAAPAIATSLNLCLEQARSLEIQQWIFTGRIQSLHRQNRALSGALGGVGGLLAFVTLLLLVLRMPRWRVAASGADLGCAAAARGCCCATALGSTATPGAMGALRYSRAGGPGGTGAIESRICRRMPRRQAPAPPVFEEKGVFTTLDANSRPETPSIIYKALRISEQQDLLRGRDGSASIIASSDAPSGSARVAASHDCHAVAPSTTASSRYAHSAAPSTSTGGGPVAAWRHAIAGRPASTYSNPFSLAETHKGSSCAASVKSRLDSSAAREALLAAYAPSTASSSVLSRVQGHDGSSALDSWWQVLGSKARELSARSTSTAAARVGESSGSEERSRASRGS